MALVELCDGLSNEACVELGEINWFVLQRLRILFAAPCCPSSDLGGGGKKGRKKQKYIKAGREEVRGGCGGRGISKIK